MAYDPREQGAQCDRCYLRTRRVGEPVPTKWASKKSLCMIIGKGPGPAEVEDGAPYVGEAGKRLTDVLTRAGVRRNEVTIANVIECLPAGEPDGAFDRAQKKAAALQKAGHDVLKPVEACRPRLLAQMQRHEAANPAARNYILLGSEPWRAVAGEVSSITAVRGGMVADRVLKDIDPSGDPVRAQLAAQGRKILPMNEPAFANRRKRWLKTLYVDGERAFQWFRGEATWQPPEMYLHPTVEEAHLLLEHYSEVSASWDTETDGLDALVVNWRCASIGSADSGMLLGWQSIHAGRSLDQAASGCETPDEIEAAVSDYHAAMARNGRFYSQSEEWTLKWAWLDLLQKPREVPLGGWNCLYTGTPVILADGTSEPIENLVRSKYAGEVKALGPNGQIITARVTDWFRTTQEGQKWITIRRVGEKGGARGLTLTPDHQVYTRRGLIRADWVRPGDEILDGDRQVNSVVVESVAKFVPPAETAQQRRIGKTRYCLQTTAGNFQTGFGFVKNCGSYDYLLMLAQYPGNPVFGGPIVIPADPVNHDVYLIDWTDPRGVHHNVWLSPDNGFLDGILVHSDVEPENPHNLGYGASVWSGGLTPAWKADRAATTSRTDHDLHVYAVNDAVMTERATANLLIEAEKMDLFPAVVAKHRVQRVASHMHAMGLLVDRDRVAEHEQVLLRGGYDPADLRKCDSRYAKWLKAAKFPEGGLPDVDFVPHFYRGAIGGDRPYLKELQDLAGREKLNPNSVPQLRDLFYDVWRLPVPRIASAGGKTKPKLTKGGDPSTDDESVRWLMHMLSTGLKTGDIKDPTSAVYHQPEAVKWRFFDALRRYRSQMKAWGTFIKRMVPKDIYVEASPWDLSLIEDSTYGRGLALNRDYADGFGNGEAAQDVLNAANSEDIYEEVAATAADIKSQKEKVAGYIWPDGRVRASYSAHRTSIGRLAASNPNILNQPARFRDMFVPAKGNTYVGADMDQIHLRIAASRWNLTVYLEAFAMGADPHAATGALCFPDSLPRGTRFREMPGFPPGEWVQNRGYWFYIISDPTQKWGGNAKKCRNTSKSVQYATLYKAENPTVARVIKETEDEFGNLMYADLTDAAIDRIIEAWMSGVPELPTGWRAEIRFYQEHGYIQEPILGRRRPLLDNEGKNESEIVNTPILAAEASIMGDLTADLAAEIGYRFDWRGKNGDGRCRDGSLMYGVCHQNYDSLLAEVPIADADRVVAMFNRVLRYENRAILPGVVLTSTAQSGPNMKEA